ncbi:MAG: class I SAM-dependent methyltransferase [Ignavibacteria bacterium]|nr:class I SAM-dependent methyltransferase [Ignavibacteria bacterium]
MFNKHIRRPFKRWVRGKLRNQLVALEAEKAVLDSTDPFRIPVSYLPYSGQSNSYIFRRNQEDQEVCEYGLPVPPKELWLGYGRNSKEYLYSGKDQVKKMTDILLECNFEAKSAGRILELGCGAGRMLRWLHPMASDNEIYGVDISAEHIFWANRNLKPPFSFATTTIVPHLPFEDNFFGLIFAGSVFTHIDDQVETWLFELARCLKPGGKFYVTIHDMKTIDHLRNTPVFKDSFLSKLLSEDQNYKIHGNNFDMLVIGRGPDSQVFFDPSYFYEIASPRFRSLGLWESAYGYQSAVVLEKI